MQTTTKHRPKKEKNVPAPSPVTLRGIVTKRIFYNAENGYCVLSLNVTNWGNTDRENTDIDIFNDIKATGHMPTVREGDEYKFTGHYTTHPKYGPQFKFSQAELILPSSRAGIARYLSHVAPGVGIKKAERIVAALGEDALERIKEDPSILNNPDLSFLTQTQKDDIAQDLNANSVQAELAGMLCRPGSGIGMGTVAKIMAEYGEDAVRVVKENPYILSQDLFGVGFLTADAIAQSVGIAPDSPFRIEAAINFLLRESGQEGHVYLQPRDVVARLIGRKGLLEASGVEVPMIARANERIIAEGRCIREGDAVYCTELYHAEKNVATAVRRLAGKEKKEIVGLDKMVSLLEQKYSIEYAPEQKKAITAALQYSISVITGGPGTGKSEITRAIVEAYHTQNPKNKIYLCAPTGRASKRLGEATGHEAKTVHRLLRYHPEIGGFEYGFGNPLPGPGLLIADEVSMMDIELAACLFSAVEDLQVILVGDIDQLPSVGPGSVLRDIIASGCVETTRLNFNYRQAGGSKIAEFANMVCRGDMPVLRNEGDFEFVPVEDGDQAAETVLRLVAGIMAEGYGSLDWAVLAPMRRGSAGVHKLNEQLRELVNPAGPGKPELWNFRLGDKVMVVKNHYGLGVFNGDLGIVAGIEKNKLTVDFGDGGGGNGGGGVYVDFAPEDLEILTLAYASTIHKSQGSEFPFVIMPLVHQHYIMLQRNLLYTGMTRAKKRLVLVAEERSVKQAVRNNVIEERFSMLAERIRGEQ
jgi:exodeoxyribonuclease V alpha subunit